MLIDEEWQKETSEGLMMKRPRWRETLKIKSLQKKYFCSQSDLCPLKALNRAFAMISSSQSGTSFLMYSATESIFSHITVRTFEMKVSIIRETFAYFFFFNLKRQCIIVGMASWKPKTKVAQAIHISFRHSA